MKFTDSTAKHFDMSIAMNSKDAVRRLAIRHRNRLWFWFIVILGISLLSMSIGGWAVRHHAWQAQAVAFIFASIGSISMFTLVFIGVMIKGWYTLFKGAMEAADWYSRDPDAFLFCYREVFGPIRWR